MNQATTRDECEEDYLAIRQVISGEREAFQPLVTRHQDKVFAMVLRTVGDSEVAKEITNEAFLKAYLNLTTFRQKSSFSTWLIRIALNLSHSYFASRPFKQKKKQVHLEKVHYENITAANNPGFDEDTVKHLHIAIGSLKPIYREAIILCGLEQKSYEDAAAILNIPIGTVRSRLNKARNLLRAYFFQGGN